MYLAALDLQGFKSFAKKTQLVFTPGVTCVVGPNGSGKSAIADGIRWVLGEQSLKSIRAKRGDEVIFQGSRSRPRLGMAEVSLTLADAETSGLDAAEVVVTRRVDRSGASAYGVNGREVRLFDLAELLVGAGFAQKSYTVIPQGMIDAFVTVSPQERRQMFEDATGVTPLLLKQERTDRKLRETHAQVLRARDLLRELEPRLRSLKRAANRARSRAEVETQLRAAEEQYAVDRWGTYDTLLKELDEKRRAAEEKAAGVSENLARLEAPEQARLSETEKIPELRATLTRLRDQERELFITLTRAEVGGGEDVDRVAEEITARTKEREKLTHELNELHSSLAAAEAKRDRLERELHSAHEALLTPWSGAASLPAEIRQALTELFERASRLAARLRTATRLEELATLVKEAEDLQRALELFGERVRRTLAAPPETGTGRMTVAHRLPLLTQERGDAEQRLTGLRVREAALRERLRAVEERLDVLRRQRASVRETPAPPTELPSRLETVQQDVRAVEAELARLQDVLLRAQAERATMHEEQQRLRNLLHAAEEERTARVVELTEAKTRWDDLLRDVTERLGGDFATRLQRGDAARTPASDPDALRAQIEQLRKKLFEIGGIDPSVLQEEAAVEQRVTEFHTQVADLDAAQKNLKEALKELERHIHERFSTSFQAVNEAFNRTFRDIFGGGRASLSLVKPKPIEHAFPDLPPEEAEGQPVEPHVHELPAGVEIHASPPGKKVQGLAQLSGGEKALTSIALLFAVLSLRASPFVVLDEVDAALDEANSRRFAHLLRQLAERTQFIVITHNRATMEAASALYGVTMGDDGVSQLLSVKLEEVPEGTGRSPGVQARQQVLG
ncbi:MAG: Uncharacterized protein G01um101438_1059 [Parcubacteria group bacterium Gr01-1014_38]|nr:MAG: Uncharacterized protein G01um101438_1059 [Parcubacteria group bacterium Gr01-1014_38]